MKRLSLLVAAALPFVFSSCDKPDVPQPQEEEPILFVRPKKLTLPSVDAEGTFQVTSNMAWTAVVDGASWLNLDRTGTEAPQEDVVVKVTAEDNPDNVERTATVVVSAGQEQRIVTVIQEAKYVDPAVELARRQNIPHIYIDVDGQKIADKKNYIKGTVIVRDPEMLYSDVPEQVLEMTENGIRGRGNSTWAWPKKPYKLKFDEKVSVLGFPADKEWCLLANYADLSLLRNLTAMEISRICGFSWTPRMCTVEVTLDGEYQGVYNFCEHKKISKNRVNIEVCEGNEGDAVTGGYYFEIDERSVGTDEPCWETPHMKIPMLFCEPEEPTVQQWDYVTKYFEDFESALMRGDFSEKTGYSNYIDVKSFIDYYIIQELTKNPDGSLRLSSFLTKEQGKKLEMYHVWDFDLTMGVCGYFESTVGNGPENFYIKDSGWYPYMFADPVFVSELQTRWRELYPVLKTIPDFIQENALYISKAAARNFLIWDIASLPGAEWVHYTPKGSYEKEVEFFKDFYSRRLEWLDGALRAL